jgi:hypothetical protein
MMTTRFQCFQSISQSILHSGMLTAECPLQADNSDLDVKFTEGDLMNITNWWDRNCNLGKSSYHIALYHIAGVSECSVHWNNVVRGDSREFRVGFHGRRAQVHPFVYVEINVLYVYSYWRQSRLCPSWNHYRFSFYDYFMSQWLDPMSMSKGRVRVLRWDFWVIIDRYLWLPRSIFVLCGFSDHETRFSFSLLSFSSLSLSLSSRSSDSHNCPSADGQTSLKYWLLSCLSIQFLALPNNVFPDSVRTKGIWSDEK